MKLVQNAIKNNKHFQYFLFICIIAIAIFQYRFFNEQKKENISLRIKILSLNEPKKTPKTFSELKNKASVLNKSLVTAPKITTLSLEADQKLILQDLETSALASLLKNKMKNIKTLEEKELQQNLELANEIISREPNSYSSYKSKLISLLTLEGKFNNDVSDEEIGSILENMAQFNFENESITRREAFVMATTDKKVMNFENQIETLEQEREDLNIKLEELEGDSPEYQDIMFKIQSLVQQEEQIFANIELITQKSNSIVNEELIEIPFMRMLAKSDYENIKDNAQTLIDQFPESPTAYYYLIRALEAEGQQEEALNVIGNSNLPNDIQSDLLKRLDNTEIEDPKNYWERLSF